MRHGGLQLGSVASEGVRSRFARLDPDRQFQAGVRRLEPVEVRGACFAVLRVCPREALLACDGRDGGPGIRPSLRGAAVRRYYDPGGSRDVDGVLE